MAALPDTARATDLYERFAPRLFGFCLQRLGSREEAEDAVQTTFLNAFRGLSRGVVPASESAWLFKIAENVCLSRHRASFRRRRLEAPGDLSVVEETVPAPQRADDELIPLEDALAEMPETQRRALLLREWQGLSYREIAAELEVSQSAVETLIFRARRGLARRLEAPRERLRRVGQVVDVGSLLAGLKGALSAGAAVKAVVAGMAVTGLAVGVAVDRPQLRRHDSPPTSQVVPAQKPGARTSVHAKAPLAPSTVSPTLSKQQVRPAKPVGRSKPAAPKRAAAQRPAARQSAPTLSTPSAVVSHTASAAAKSPAPAATQNGKPHQQQAARSRPAAKPATPAPAKANPNAGPTPKAGDPQAPSSPANPGDPAQGQAPQDPPGQGKGKNK